MFVFVALVAAGDYLYYLNRLYPGIYFKDLHLGGSTFQQAEKLLEDAQITFYGPEGKSITFSLSAMGIELDEKEVLETGYWQGRPKSWPWTFKHRLSINKEGLFIPFRYNVNSNLFSHSTDFISSYFSREAENAYFDIDGSQAKLVAEKYGYVYDSREVKQLVLANLARPDLPLEIRVPYAEIISPEITMATYEEKGIEGLMSSYTTKFDPSVVNRVHNLQLASAQLNNYFLAPGEVLSVNRVIGDTVAEKGYKKAPVIVGGKLSEGIGGGICQVSTTLYNTALLANLDIVERHNHHLTVLYIDPGRDATISYPVLDFKFRNNRDHYVLITSQLEKDSLTFRLFGRPLAETVEISSEVLDTFPPPVKYQYAADLNPGEEEIIEGHPGYLADVWKRVYLGDELKSEEKISTDRYSPHPRIIRQGPQE
ncbi:VanW family protein [Dethiobacter alkaliphilus AHT 1]|uniref:VanW family protein n=1 Tax=Dethiobacter alkaliphilus AHT 1 TaxID=555088 RepID=C0GK11_DETAL|nr:VanW family protein [Dethiobacter alkaliphilus AHT 1]